MRTAPLARANPSHEPFQLDDFPCEKTVVQSADGSEHILFQHPPMAIQLAVHGTSVVNGPVRAIFEIDGLNQARMVTTAIKTLIQLKNKTGAEPSRAWSLAQLHLRDYLIALDGSLAGASYRKIAQTIYGDNRVNEVWTGDSRFLKDRIRRAVAVGKKLMKGGYRNLLRKP